MKDHCILPEMIILFNLITFSLDFALTLLGENWCWSLYLMEVVSKETEALPAWLRCETSKFSFVKSMDQVNQPRSQDPTRPLEWERIE